MRAPGFHSFSRITVYTLVVLVLALTGCEKKQRKTSGGSLLEGDTPEPTGTVYRFVGVEQSLADARKAVQDEHWDQALAASDALLREQPNNAEAQTINNRARLELANAHAAEAAAKASAEAALRQSRAAQKKDKKQAMANGKADEKDDEPSPMPTARAPEPIPTSAVPSTAAAAVLTGVAAPEVAQPALPPPPPKEVTPAPTPAPSPVAPKVTETERKALIRDYLMQKVQPHVKRNFSYPKDAERQGIEGTVIVRLNVASSGSLISSKVVSCPDPILCQAALAAANEAAPYSPPPAVLGPSVIVDVRFEYRME
jgi:periplasmic protein TonB